MSPSQLRLIIALFFLSGATGLLYEVVWAKYLGLFLGNTGLAHAVVLATFMGGLALGNALLGRLADRTAHPLYLYGWLELGVGLFATVSPALLTGLAGAYVHAAAGAGWPEGLQLAAKVAVAALALLPPTILMGGTLPALSRFTTTSLAGMQSAIGRLYFLNSAGAVAGALLAGFVWVPAYGLDRSIWLGAAVNLLIGVVAIGLSKRMAPMAAAETASEPDAPVYGPLQVRAILVAVAVSGFVSLAYEVAWIRLLTLVLGSSAYSFALMLAAFVGGIALGSRLVERHRLPGADPYTQFGWAQWGIALAVLVTLPFYPELPFLFLQLGAWVPRAEGFFYVFEGVKLVVCFLLMLAPATCIGMTLPLASRVATRAIGEVGTRVGAVFSLNTLGNVLGSLMAGLVLLPALGIRGLIEAGVALNVLVAGGIAAARPQMAPARRAALVAMPLVAVGLYHVGAPQWEMGWLTAGTYRNAVAAQGESIAQLKQKLASTPTRFHQDDHGATVTVREAGDQLILHVNGKADASSKGDLSTQILLAQVPMLLAPKSQDVFMVGLGSGITAGSVLKHPVRSLDLVEISPAVVAANRFFAEANGHALADPRLKLHLDDAGSFLRLSPNQYDVMISEPSNPWVAGVGNLFTADYYDEAKRHLRPGGLMVQWFHAYEMDDETFRLIVRTFASAFPHTQLWQCWGNDYMLVGSNEAIHPNFAAMEAAMARPAVASELARIGVRSVPGLLSLQSASDPAVRQMAGTGPLNADRWPILEYAAPKGFFMGTQTRLPATHDERMASARSAGRGLLLNERQAQGPAFTSAQFAEMAAFQRTYIGRLALQEVFLDAWQRRFPQDEQALAERSAWLQASDRDDEAAELLERLLAAHPARAEYLDQAVDLAFRRLGKHTSFLGADEAAYRRALAHLDALRKLQPEAADGLDRRAAALAFIAGHRDEGYAAIDRSAGRAEPVERCALWMQAAQSAFDGRDYPATARYLKRIVAIDSEYQPAIALAEEMMRVAGDRR